MLDINRGGGISVGVGSRELVRDMMVMVSSLEGRDSVREGPFPRTSSAASVASSLVISNPISFSGCLADSCLFLQLAKTASLGPVLSHSAWTFHTFLRGVIPVGISSWIPDCRKWAVEDIIELRLDSVAE